MSLQWNVAITSFFFFSYIYYYWGKENRSLYGGLRYKEDLYIEALLHLSVEGVYETPRLINITE